MLNMFAIKSVATITASFKQMIEELDLVRQRSLGEAHDQEQIAQEAELRRSLALKEADEAERVSAKIAALIGKE